MTDRELDAAVGRVVFGWLDVPDQLPRYCNSWVGIGCIVERMRKLGFVATIAVYRACEDFSVTFWSPTSAHGTCVGAMPVPRAAAIAVVLAVKGMA